MDRNRRRRSPLGHRMLVFSLCSLLTILVFWLLGFVISDIGRLPGPDRDAIYGRHIDQELVDQVEAKQREQETVGLEISAQRDLQEILETSLSNSRSTMDQLIELHQLNLRMGVTPTEAEQTALAESEHLFLENQRRFQEANEQIAGLSEQQRTLAEEIRVLDEQITAMQEPAWEEFRGALRRHNFRIASFKLAFLVPLLLVVGGVTQRWRGSPHVPILWAVLIAAFLRVGLVMHQHFPREFFKYIAIGASIVIVLLFVIHVIRLAASPRGEWLLRQHREAYRRQRCPICDFPILHGVAKHMAWIRAGSFGAGSAERGEGETGAPWVCPSCGQRLFERCESCGAIRHSLLPHCASCGQGKGIAPGPAENAVSDQG